MDIAYFWKRKLQEVYDCLNNSRLIWSSFVSFFEEGLWEYHTALLILFKELTRGKHRLKSENPISLIELRLSSSSTHVRLGFETFSLTLGLVRLIQGFAIGIDLQNS